MKMLALLVLVFSGIFAEAYSPSFRAKTDDLTVDNRCEQYLPHFFLQEDVTFFTVSIEGMKRAGFDEEVPVKRDEAKNLWRVLNPNSKPVVAAQSRRYVETKPYLKDYLSILEEGRVSRGARYYAEGEVLEVLSYEFLPRSDSFLKMIESHFGHNNFRYQDFFITGGVSYYNQSGRTLGELDVVVGDANTCTVFAIGEAKLGGKRGKALRQLERIADFLESIR